MLIALLITLVIALVSGYLIRNIFYNSDWEIVDDLDGNVFPSVIVSTALAKQSAIVQNDSNVIASSKSPFAIKLKNKAPNSRIHIEIGETEYFEKSECDVVAPVMGRTYLVYPDVVWKYDALRNNRQSKPFNVSVKLNIGIVNKSYKSRTLSMRSINECLLGYYDHDKNYHSTSYFYAAYVNEESPMIDSVLHEALDAKIVKQFVAYQFGGTSRVKKEVFAIWYALQRHGFKYSSLTNTSISSKTVFTQRVRLIDDSFKSQQLNCVDGTVLFASVLKGVGIDPLLIRVPGHMFLGYFLDKKHKKVAFLETTMLGTVDVRAAEDSLGVAGAQNRSLTKFNRATESATKRYENSKKYFSERTNPNYMFLEINKSVRNIVQPLGE